MGENPDDCSWHEIAGCAGVPFVDKMSKKFGGGDIPLSNRRGSMDGGARMSAFLKYWEKPDERFAPRGEAVYMSVNIIKLTRYM